MIARPENIRISSCIITDQGDYSAIECPMMIAAKSQTICDHIKVKISPWKNVGRFYSRTSQYQSWAIPSRIRHNVCDMQSSRRWRIGTRLRHALPSCDTIVPRAAFAVLPCSSRNSCGWEGALLGLEYPQCPARTT